jgi:hypothetical protein
VRTLPLTEPPDVETSPITGWTRGHWDEICRVLLAGIMDSASPGKARPAIPGPRSHHGADADAMEGFARSFLMAGAWLHGRETGTFANGGRTLDVAGHYRDGLLAGTDRRHPEYWGDVGDRSQHLVECAALAVGLWFSRRVLWETLDAARRAQVAGYLLQCTRARYDDCNWILFRLAVNTVLKRLDRDYVQAQIDEDLAACDRMYAGDGWYRDGPGHRFDYYNAWVFHYYALLWVMLDGAARPAAAEVFTRRAAVFFEGFRHFFGADGAAPCFGRSMLYRFAYLGPLPLGVLLGCPGMETGQARTLMNLGARFFVEKAILTDRGHLSPGYIGPRPELLEPYSCGGSPYWAGKAFSILLIPPDDPFWHTPELPLPVHQADTCVALPAPGFLLAGRRRDGHVQLVNHGSSHKRAYAGKYMKLAYSSIFAGDPRPDAADAGLQFSRDGATWHPRGEPVTLFCEPGFAASCYRLPGADERGHAVTYTVVKDGSLLHVHRVVARRRLWFREGGYALGFDEGEPVAWRSASATAVRVDDRLSYIRSLAGYAPAEAALPSNGTARHRRALVPLLRGRGGGAGHGHILASQVCGGAGPASCPEAADALVDMFRIDGHAVWIRFADGECVFLQIGDVDAVDIRVNGAALHGRVAMARVSPAGRAQVVTLPAGAPAAHRRLPGRPWALARFRRLAARWRR